MSFTFVGNEGIYSMGKGKKVTLKILQVESSVGTWRDGLSREALMKCSLTLDFSASNMCFSRGLFPGRLLARYSQNPLVHPIYAQFFTNLILNLIQ